MKGFCKKKIKFSATHPHPEGLSGLRDSRHSEQPSDTTRPRTSSETGKSLRAETQSRLIHFESFCFKLIIITLMVIQWEELTTNSRVKHFLKKKHSFLRPASFHEKFLIFLSLHTKGMEGGKIG